ncbi:hypothetical protein [Pseudonocardia sp. N23]|uniref:hypothetical protein n=1 Tax=Pseudonocardia sp. N23 TaxID=1987376 RepID=UPI000BFE75F2|nr:hypothetical protein [Pseudonocardia sp. N23]
MTADPIPAVAEADAVGETAEIFEDLRTTLGLPFVNLIWRHLATVPGALPAVWDTVKPLYGTEVLRERVAAIREEARAAQLDGLPGHVWDALGVGPDTRRGVAEVIDDYNHANSVNFLVMTTVAAVLHGAAAGPAAPGRPAPAAPWPSPPRTGAPPLPSMSALTPDLQALVRAADELGRLGPGVAHASLYRHLTLWPPFLATAYVALLPSHREGVLQATQRRLLERARRVAVDDLLPLLDAERLDIGGAARRTAQESVDEFATLMIGRMVVTGTAMRGLLG